MIFFVEMHKIYLKEWEMGEDGMGVARGAGAGRFSKYSSAHKKIPK